ncbi:MAG: DUF305 domain-containing protein [Thermoleophilaceae bacterium]|nr:DUF305 domain-containing protein [Thermoleophilaceae bacterium]
MNITAANHRRPTWRVLALVLVAAIGIVVAGCGSGDESDTAASGEGNPTEQAFLEAMAPHHQSAVEMTDVAEERAEAPEIMEIADQIATTQEGELAQMEDIHERLFGAPLVPNPGAHEELGLSPEEAGAEHEDAALILEDADPFDEAFVDEMVPHHEGATAMAEAALPEMEDPEIRELAEGIVATQEEEIAEMNAFREEEYGAPVPESGGHESEAAPAEEEAPEEHGGGHSG